MSMKTKNLKLNIILNAISSVLSIVVPLITMPYFSRILKPTGLGIYSFNLSFVNYFYTFAVLGIGTYGIIACSKVRNNKIELSKTTSELFLINLVLSIISYGTLIILSFTLPKLNQSIWYLLIIALSSVTTVLNLNWLLQANEDFVFTTVKGITTNILCVICLFIFVREENDLWKYIYLNMSFGIISNIINYVHAKKYIKFTYKNLNFSRHIKPILLYFSISLATSVFMDIDKILLGFMCGENGDYYVGIYDASSKINNIFIGIISSTIGILCPRMSYLISANQYDEFNNLLRKALKYVLILSVSIVIFVSYFGSSVVLILLGEEYKPSIQPMIVLLPIIIIKSILNIFNLYFMSYKKEYSITIALIVGAILNIILNVILIPYFNVMGVVIATLISEILVMIIEFLYIKKYIINILRLKDFVVLLEMIVILVPITFVCSSYLNINFIANLFVSAAIFGSIFLCILLVNKDELIFDIINRFKRRKIK